MKLKYLGSGGGGGIPELFCNCRVCCNARVQKGVEYRARPLALINDELCIDLPCDAQNSFAKHNVDPRTLKAVLITHAHYDHFMADNFISRPEDASDITLCISRGSGDAFAQRYSAIATRAQPCMLRPIALPQMKHISAFETIALEEYNITALPANHARSIEALNYIISHKGKNILWLHDTGVLLEETKSFLCANGIRFDFVSMDCAHPEWYSISEEHMNIHQCKLTADYLKAINAADDETLFFVSHISHLLGLTHTELAATASSLGLGVAYDGMEIEI